MITDDDIISAEEKIKQLVEFEQDKRKEFEQKKKELEEKQKELTQLEKQGKQEIEVARKEIEEKIGELATEEKQRFEELEELRRRREVEEAASLEETVEQEERAGRVREVPVQRGYNEVIEEIMQGNPNFYDITNYNVVNRLENIARDAVDRPLSASERTFIDNVHYHAERVRDSYQESGGGESPYIKRELEQIDNINRMLREREKPGEYQP